MAFKRQDFLFLPLRDLKLSVYHLSLGFLISNGARRVGVVTIRHRICVLVVKHFNFGISLSLLCYNFYLLCHNHLHEHFQCGIAVPGSQT